MSIELNGNKFTTWSDVEKELFTPEELKTRQITFDDDCSELTAEQLKQFVYVSKKNHKEYRID